MQSWCCSTTQIYYSYYRRYVKGFAAIAAPLHALTRKDALFHWSEDCQTTFDQLKARLTTSPITAFPDFSQEFRLYTDASTAGLGAILAQVREGKERIICCASRALNKAEKSYPATKLECLAIAWAVAKFRPYLMAMPFEVFTDHYALQWLKTMRTGSALLHRWSAALEEYDFTVRHRPGKIQTHVDGLSRLPVGPAPPEDALLHLQVDNEEEARRLAQELHTATHLGGQALWKLFSDRYFHKAGRRICIEVAQNCPQCQRGSDYGPPPEDHGNYRVQGPVGHSLCGHCGSTPRRPPTRVRHRVRGLLFQVHCASACQQSYRGHGERGSSAPCRAVLRYTSPPLVRSWKGVCWGSLGEVNSLSRNPEAINLSISPRGQLHQRTQPQDHEQHAPGSFVEGSAL